jgi:class 3 adenylate cyclase
MSGSLLTWGEGDEMRDALARLESLAEHRRDPFLDQWLLNEQALFATWSGQLDRVLALADEMNALGQQHGFELATRQTAGRARRRALLYLGRPATALDTIPSPPKLWANGGAFSAQRAIYLAHSGDVDVAAAIINQFLVERDFAAPADRSAATLLRFLLEAGVAANHHAAVSVLEPQVRPMADLLFTEANITNCIGRDLGGAARLLRQPEKARAYYLRGLAAAEKGRHRPEIALCHLELAELLFDDYPEERVEALAHLDFAIGELQAMCMQTFLERALRRKMQVQGVESVTPSTSIDAVAQVVEVERPNLQPQAAPDGTVTLLFTDIEDSTGHTLRLGDQRWLEILRAHHALVREQIQKHGGFEVKSQGDGFMLAFSSARRAVDCAIAIQRAVTATHTEPPILVRMGLHTGEALKDADDFHGRDVVLAARIANEARGGEILVSALLKELTASSTLARFSTERELTLKGLDGTHRVFAVEWSA